MLLGYRPGSTPPGGSRSHKRVAVTGVSRTPGNHGSTVVYKRLRERGYDVSAVNPNADEVEGARAYHELRSTLAASRRT